MAVEWRQWQSALGRAGFRLDPEGERDNLVIRRALAQWGASAGVDQPHVETLVDLVQLDQFELEIVLEAGSRSTLGSTRGRYSDLALTLALSKGRCLPLRGCRPAQSIEQAELDDLLIFSGDVQKVRSLGIRTAEQLVRFLPRATDQVIRNFAIDPGIGYLGRPDDYWSRETFSSQSAMWSLKADVIDGRFQG